MGTNKHYHGPGVAVKFALIAAFVGLIFCLVAIGASYKSMFVLLMDTAGNDQKKMAELMASAIGNTVDEKIALLIEQTYRPKEAAIQGAETGKANDLPAGPILYESSFGEMLLDEASGIWALPLNITMLDKSGKAVDTRKALLGIDTFFSPLKDFKIGHTGHAALVDSRTYLIFSPGAKPFSNKFSSYNELQKVLSQRSGWLLMNGVYGHQGEAFVAFCALDYPLLLRSGINWRVFVVRDAREVFAPLKELVKLEIAVGLILIIVLSLAGFMLGKLLVRPVKKINYGIEHLGKGDFNYRIEVDSADELGRLADSFNTMAESLGETATLKADLNKETAMRRRAEDKVRQLVQEWQKAFDAIKSAVAGSQSTAGANIDEMIKNANKLLDASKIDTDKIELNLKLIDMRELIKNAVFKFEPKIRGKNLDMKLDMPKGHLPVNADEDKVNQVIGVLINNALRFTEKGYIDILVRETSDDIRCSIIDTGKAIPSEDIPKLFDSLHNLNLSISKAIIEKHGGKIWVERDLNNLTKITFSLPIVKNNT